MLAGASVGVGVVPGVSSPVETFEDSACSRASIRCRCPFAICTALMKLSIGSVLLREGGFVRRSSVSVADVSTWKRQTSIMAQQAAFIVAEGMSSDLVEYR